jgi:hypothetical protein
MIHLLPILLFLNSHLEVLQYREGETHSVLLMDRRCMEEVRKYNVGKCLPIDYRYIINQE